MTKSLIRRNDDVVYLDKKDVVFHGISERQLTILKVIVEEYIEKAEPISSMLLVEKYFPNVSSATIRNEMSFLEKKGLIEKKHQSAGRIPSVEAYKLYNTITSSDIFLDESIKSKIIKALNKRGASIDDIINESVAIINDLTKLPAVVTETHSDELLKRIDLIVTNEQSAIILIVTSYNRVVHHPIIFDKNINLNDLQVCIQVLDERLINTVISEISTKLYAIKEVIRNKIKDYEFYIQNIVEKIFNHYYQKPNIKTQTIGFKHAVALKEFEEPQKLQELLALLEDSSIWQQIALNKKMHGKTLITYGEQIDRQGFAIASTSINIPNVNKQIALVGPTRMDYSNAKALLDFLKEELEKITTNNIKNNN